MILSVPNDDYCRRFFFNIYVCHKVADIGIKGHIMKILKC